MYSSRLYLVPALSVLFLVGFLLQPAFTRDTTPDDSSSMTPPPGCEALTDTGMSDVNAQGLDSKLTRMLEVAESRTDDLNLDDSQTEKLAETLADENLLDGDWKNLSPQEQQAKLLNRVQELDSDLPILSQPERFSNMMSSLGPVNGTIGVEALQYKLNEGTLGFNVYDFRLLDVHLGDDTCGPLGTISLGGPHLGGALQLRPGSGADDLTTIGDRLPSIEQSP